MKYDGSENPTIPQWLDEIPIKERGLDLLGLRNPVLSIGNVFLSGVTTITPSVRNLSYRCWMIWIYAQWNLPASPSSWKSFRERVESAFALSNIIVDRNVSGVIGSQKAKLLIDEGTKEIELVNLVRSQKAYATYTNISEQLGLTIEDSDLIPSLTKERGKVLAEEFDSRIKNTSFYNKLKKDPQLKSLLITDLNEFGKKIKLDVIPNKEAKLLIAAICPQDPFEGKINEYYRICTYSILLEIAKIKKRLPYEEDLFEYAIAKKNQLLPMIEYTRTGWLIYLMRDVLAVTHEVLFEYLYYRISRQPLGIDENEVINNIVNTDEEIIDVLKRLNIIKSKSQYKSLSFNKLLEQVRKLINNNRYYSDIARWNGEIDEEIIINEAWKYNGVIALVPIAWIIVYLRIEKYLENKQPSDLITLFGERSRQLNFVETIYPLLKKYQVNNTPIKEVLEEILRLTINQHFKIAWLRFANDPFSVAVLFRDENLLKERRKFRAGRIQSRLIQAIGWLEQLKLIDENGITEKGLDQHNRNLKVLKGAL